MTKRRSFGKKVREQVFAKTHGHCAYCGCELTLDKMQVDHIYPFEKGGSNELDNLFPACWLCNYRKKAFTVDEFREMLADIPRCLFKAYTTYDLAVKYGLIVLKEEPVEFYFERMCKE